MAILTSTLAWSVQSCVWNYVYLFEKIYACKTFLGYIVAFTAYVWALM